MESKYGFHTTEARSSLMSKIRSEDTTPEVVLRKKLWALGCRYRKNYKKLPGKPDIVFVKQKVAVFIDGEFWHGFNWHEKKGKIKTNSEYWIKKIEGNIARDKKNLRMLEDDGWKVIRFWTHEIKDEIDTCLIKVQEALSNA